MKGLLSLILVTLLAAACSTPKYYVFKTIKHNPAEQTGEPTQAAAEETLPEAVAIGMEAPMAEESLTASTEKTVAPVSLQQATKKIAKTTEAAEPKKISTLQKIRTAIQVKKEIKKALKEQQEMAQDPEPETNGKSQLVALILAILVGGLGIHRFYLGYTSIGIIQLLTLGGCGIWALIDLIRIATGDLKPADGSDYEEKI